MIFPLFAFVAVFTSVIFWLFGVTPPDGSIWGVLFSSGNSIQDVLVGVIFALGNSIDIFSNLFGGLITIVGIAGAIGGVMYGRDEPLYGGLGILLFKMLGLYSIIDINQLPVGSDVLLLAFIGLFNTIFIISFINWIRGKGE